MGFYKRFFQRLYKPSISCICTKKTSTNTFQQFRRETDAHEIARDFFDINYVKSFKEEWPAIRCAMLSRKKYVAVVNNFVDTDLYTDNLFDSGAYDFILKLHQRAAAKSVETRTKVEKLNQKLQNYQDMHQIIENGSDSEDKSTFFTQEQATNINEISEKIDELKAELTIFDKLKTVCAGVQAYVYPKGNFTEMNENIKDSVHSSFFLDASTILPVLALDPQPYDHILDLCAAPGGKLNVLIQAFGGSDIGGIVANDLSIKKVSGALRAVRQFLPKKMDINRLIKATFCDGTNHHGIGSDCYSKVLVDVPSTMDRMSMYKSETGRDNIFSALRKQERAALPELQSLLLRNAILACQTGGLIVYSTSTASDMQNQFVVQYTLQNLLEEHGVICEVENLRPLTSLLQDEFHFHDDVNLGVLVKPRLDANFGPTYFCKLRRET